MQFLPFKRLVYTLMLKGMQRKLLKIRQSATYDVSEHWEYWMPSKFDVCIGTFLKQYWRSNEYKCTIVCTSHEVSSLLFEFQLEFNALSENPLTIIILFTIWPGKWCVRGILDYLYPSFKGQKKVIFLLLKETWRPLMAICQ